MYDTIHYAYSTRCRLALLHQKLTNLERQVEYIEARVTKT